MQEYYQCPPCCPYRNMAQQMADLSKNFRQEEMVPPSCQGGFVYTVVPGDTMYHIAQRYHLSLDSLIRANPQITNPNLITPGQRICIPVSIPAPVDCQGGYLYTVVRGDTLTVIAQRFDLAVQDLLQANPRISNPNHLFIGQQLCIPLPIPEPPACTNNTYVVNKGETLASIANKFNLPIEDIISINPQITNPNLLFSGQVICLPK